MFTWPYTRSLLVTTAALTQNFHKINYYNFLLAHLFCGVFLYPGKHSHTAASPSPLQYEYGLQLLHLRFSVNNTNMAAAHCRQQFNTKQTGSAGKHHYLSIKPHLRSPFQSTCIFNCRKCIRYCVSKIFLIL